ncbi:proline-rich receptor-like protein kinase PERK10 [Triticum dicoccoides]|uniref:proline-rich receptor-like protein kinase PERK10 n=1 Tax=Triticum dicoccoides TaxID=85692 RepID=UPI001890F038|nr:proline-rich receptor-like protein kinase PERK10 [Triticum dicoccoides]
MHGRVSCYEKLPSSGRAPMLPEEALSCSPARASCGFFARQGLAAASPHELAPRARRYNLRSSKPTTCCGSPELLMRRGKEVAMEQPRRLGARPAFGPPPLRRPRAPPPRSVRPAAGSTSEQPYPPPRPPTKSRILPVLRPGGGRPRGAPIHSPPWSSPSLQAATSSSASIHPPRRPDHQPSGASCLSCGRRSNNKNCRVLYVKMNRFFGLAT